MHDQRVVLGSSLDLEDARDGANVLGIGAQAVDGFGWERDQAALAQRGNGLLDVVGRYHGLSRAL